MSKRIRVTSVISLIIIILTGCSKEPPKCSDESTIRLVKELILQQMGPIMLQGNAQEEFLKNMKIDYPLPTAFDKNIRKYSCEAKLVAGGKCTLPIRYDSQLDDHNNHIVSVAGNNISDLRIVAQAIMDKIAETSAEVSKYPESAAANGPEKKLKEMYNKTISRLEESRKSVLEKDQLAWHEQMESKCSGAGEEFKGGTLERELVNLCYEAMMEKRIEYLKKYK